MLYFQQLFKNCESLNNKLWKEKILEITLWIGEESRKEQNRHFEASKFYCVGSDTSKM